MTRGTAFLAATKYPLVARKSRLANDFFSTFRCMIFQPDFGVMVCLLAIEVGCIHVTNNLLVSLCHLDAELNIVPCSNHLHGHNFMRFATCKNLLEPFFHKVTPQNWSLFSYHLVDG